jgi:hypothetical protein
MVAIGVLSVESVLYCLIFCETLQALCHDGDDVLPESADIAKYAEGELGRITALP